MCWVCLPITLKGQMVIIHVHMLVCILLHLWMSEIVSVFLHYVQLFAEIFECLCRWTSFGINDNWCEITDTQFSSMQLKRRQRANILNVFQCEDKLVSQGPFLYFTDNIKRRRRAVSDVFLQVCVWAVTQFPSWQGHKHSNTRLYCLYRPCKRARGFIMQFYTVLLVCCCGTGLHKTYLALLSAPLVAYREQWKRSHTRQITKSSFCVATFPLRVFRFSLPLRLMKPGVTDEAAFHWILTFYLFWVLLPWNWNTSPPKYYFAFLHFNRCLLNHF